MRASSDQGELLIDVAAGVIVTRGLAALTLGDVAVAAGVRGEDLEAAFIRTDGLLTAIVDRAASLFTNVLDEAVAVTAEGDRLEALLTRQLGLVDEHPMVFRVAILRLLRPSDYPVIVPSLTSGLSRLEHYFMKFDGWLEANGIRRRDSSKLTGHVAGGAVVGALVRWASNGGRERASDEACDLASMLLR